MSTPAITDIELVDQTAHGDRHAFGQLVERHQSLVCSVAYSIVGDFSRSEDVAQEAFLIAWKQASELRDRGKFAAWICGIARNLALMVVRRERKTQPIDIELHRVSQEPQPVDRASAREEESLVWHALESLPENYREPLVLFYREQNSVARVAEAMDLSEDAVKQRLSRGREMLREEIAATIERTLRRTAPKAAFVLAVLGALPGIGSGTAVAASAVATSKAAGCVGATAVTSSLGPLFGGITGMAGGLIGIWAADQSTRYPRQRKILRKGMLLVLIANGLVAPAPLLVMGMGWWNPIETFGPIGCGLALITWILTFTVGTWIWIWSIVRRMLRTVAEEMASGATPLPLSHVQKYAEGFYKRNAELYEGRQWTSQSKFLGLPLIDIQFRLPEKLDLNSSQTPHYGRARGWIAIGDRASGLIAFGGIAIGGIACGGVSIGGLAIGGVGIGVIGLGGLGIGVLGIGGLCIGLFANGGFALGGAAAGGLAIGWLAFGGGAIAWHAAKGGLAIAHDFAIGGAAHARHANDDIAVRYFEQSQFFQLIEPVMMTCAKFMNEHSVAYNIGVGIFILVPILVSFLIGYRRRRH